MSGAPILFLVVGKPTEDNEKDLILGRLIQELRTWNEHLSGCKLETELENLTQSGIRVSPGQKELVLNNDKLSLVVLYSPTLACLKFFSKQYLAVKSCYRQLVYSGPALSECGSWLLQDGILQFGDLAQILKDVEMPDFEPFCVNAFNVGKWTQENIEKSTSLCIKLNPDVQENSGDVSGGKFLGILSTFFDDETFSLDNFEEKQRFSISSFRMPNQNSSIVKIGDFKMIINADSTKLPPRLLKDSDLALLTTSDFRLLKWLKTSFDSDEKFHFGMLYSNVLSAASQKVMESGSSGSNSLCVNVSDLLKSLTKSLNDANIPVQSCFSSNNPQPVTIYHKAGFGTLQLYPLTPSADSKESKEIQKSQISESAIANFPPTSCILLWQPFNRKSKPIRVFFTGLAPQTAILEGLGKLKNIHLFANWESLSAVENLNKLNKIKSKPEKTAAAVINGGAQKHKEPLKTSAKPKPADSSSVTSQSGHGDSVAKTHTKPKAVKSEIDKNQTLPSMTKHDKVEKNKAANMTVLSAPSKSEVTRQSLSKPLKAPVASVPVKVARPIGKETTTVIVSAKLPATPTKPQVATTTAAAAIKHATTKAPALKPTKDVKPALKATSVAKTKPKPVSTPQKKEQVATDKSRGETTPKLERKIKPVKTSEKKDVEKANKKEVKSPVIVAETALIENQVPTKEGIKAVKPEVEAKADHLDTEKAELIEETKKDEIELASPATDESEKDKAYVEIVEYQQHSDKEASDLLSPIEAVESSEEKSDQLTSSKEPEDLEEEVSAAPERAEEEKPEQESLNYLAEKPTEVTSNESEVESAVSERMSVEADENVDQEDVSEGDKVSDESIEHEVPVDDVDEDSLANEVEKEAQEPETEEVVLEDDADIQAEEEDLGPIEGHKTVLEPAKQICDEMVRSGISLAESAGTESAPHENLYSQDQDFEDESPLEEDTEHQMEKTLHADVTFETHELVVKSEAEPVVPAKQNILLESEECIEKDILEEPEKKIESEDVFIPRKQLKEVETTEEKFDDLKEKEDELAEEINEEVVKQEVCDLIESECHHEANVHEKKDEALECNDKRHVPHPEVVDKSDQTDAVETLLSIGDDVESGHETESKDDADFCHKLKSNEAESLHDGIEADPQEPVEKHELNELSVASEVTDRLLNLKDCARENEPEEIVSECGKPLEHDKQEPIKLNLDYFVQKKAEVEDGKKNVEGIGCEDLHETLKDDEARDEASPMSDAPVFDDRCDKKMSIESEESNQLIDFGTSDEPITPSLKKDTGINNLAALCQGNPFISSDDNCYSESTDSTRAVAGSISELKQSCESDADDCSKDEFNQFCGEVADHLNILKEHRDAVQKEFLSGTDSNVIFYNKNVAFHKERIDDLSEEDQDELETISEHPEIEEEEELLMDKTEPTADQSSENVQTDTKQLVETVHLPESDYKSLPDPIKCEGHEGVGEEFKDATALGVPKSCIDTTKHGDVLIGHPNDSERTLQDLSPNEAPAIHSSSLVDDAVAAWGRPMELPAPEKPKKLSLKKDAANVTQQEAVAPAIPVASDQVTTAIKRKAIPGTVKQAITNEPQNRDTHKIVGGDPKFKTTTDFTTKKADAVHKPTPVSHPFYTDVTFVYEKDDERNTSYNTEFFRRVRSRYYLLSSACLSVLDHLVEAKQTWDNADASTVAVVRQLDWPKVENWIRSKEELLNRLKISVLPDINQKILDSDLHLHAF